MLGKVDKKLKILFFVVFQGKNNKDENRSGKTRYRNGTSLKHYTSLVDLELFAVLGGLIWYGITN